ncbi:MAG: hypothetical protein K0U84_14075 [Actinomycetia bacterium]|nr:hypothetical protein [Actinomycetes bacterium]
MRFDSPEIKQFFAEFSLAFGYCCGLSQAIGTNESEGRSNKKAKAELETERRKVMRLVRQALTMNLPAEPPEELVRVRCSHCDRHYDLKPARAADVHGMQCTRAPYCGGTLGIHKEFIRPGAPELDHDAEHPTPPNPGGAPGKWVDIRPGLKWFYPDEPEPADEDLADEDLADEEPQ